MSGTVSRQKYDQVQGRGIGKLFSNSSALYLWGPITQNYGTYSMAVWKHLIVLFGGFYDPGITSKCVYLAVTTRRLTILVPLRQPVIWTIFGYLIHKNTNGPRWSWRRQIQGLRMLSAIPSVEIYMIRTDHEAAFHSSHVQTAWFYMVHSLILSTLLVV